MGFRIGDEKRGSHEVGPPRARSGRHRRRGLWLRFVFCSKVASVVVTHGSGPVVPSQPRVGEYGLRNKREVWRVKFTLAKIRKAARELLTLDEKDPRRLFEGVYGAHLKKNGWSRAGLLSFYAVLLPWKV